MQIMHELHDTDYGNCKEFCETMIRLDRINAFPKVLLKTYFSDECWIFSTKYAMGVTKTLLEKDLNNTHKKLTFVLVFLEEPLVVLYF